MYERKTEMKRHTLLLICVLTVMGWSSSWAQENGDTWFERANAAYNAGNYDSAMILYEKILALDMESMPLYYNMGNAYYKMREYPMAIYCYEKALKLDPSNEEVQTNLAIANRAIVDKIEPMPQSFIVRWWQKARTWFSSDQWAWLSIVVFALLLVSVFLFLRARKMGLRKLGFFAGWVFLLVFALSLIFAIQLKQLSLSQDHANIMTPTVNVKSSPNETSIDLFVLHEGTKVDVLETVDGWNKIKIANGSVGWLSEDSMRCF